MNRRVLNALRLDSAENVIIVKLFFESSSPTTRSRDLIDYKVITTRRIIFLRYFIRENRFQINNYFFLSDITRLDFQIRHKTKKRERMFYVSFTKVPFLSFSSENEDFDINLQGVMFLKKKINKLLDELLKCNPNANISVSWKRDDLGEASEELLYEGMSPEKKRRVRLILLLLCVVWIAAIIRILTAK
jgi:hypothetical protein